MKHGAQPLSAPDQQLWQLEPEDIHLLCSFSSKNLRFSKQKAVNQNL